jgi:tetratricopeptide (TPR) repeat protein
MTRRLVLPVLLLLVAAPPARGGLHYSGEEWAELPSRWSGFLVDQRSLRAAGLDRPGQLPPSPLREEYLKAAAKLEAAARDRKLTADEAADLGALLVRLGKPERAVEVLRAAAREHPNHFRIASNLGTAWQLAGDLEQAVAALDETVRLAPEKLREYERFHLKLVRLRLAEGRAAMKPDEVDDLFDARYVGESGKPQAGAMAAAEFKKLPADAAAIVQYLALALPADGRLLWQLGEIANAHGDIRTAAAILDGCVTEFAMAAPGLRERRQIYRTAANELAKNPGHERHRGTFVAKSPRPLVRHFDLSTLPPIRDDRPNPLPWGVLAETSIGAKAEPAFPRHLLSLDGKPVALSGFMQPLGEAQEYGGFLLLEFPVGCWFCETPGPAGLASVELEPGTRTTLKRGLIKVTGTLELNRDNPEDFLFRIKESRVSEPE